MSITKYTDKKTGKELWRVRIIKRSSIKPGLRIDRQVSGLASQAEALKAAKKLNTEAGRALFAKEIRAEDFLWGNLIAEWELAARGGDIFIRPIKLGTVGDYLAALNKYTKEWMNQPVGQIDKATAWRLLNRVDREVSASRKKRLRTAIDAVFNWGMLSGRLRSVSQIPTDGFRSTRMLEEKMPEILNIGEIKALLKSAKSLNHPWASIWAMALLTGMRSGELYALTWEKLDLEGGIIYVHQNWSSKDGIGSTKGRYWRTLPISSELKRLLTELKLKSKGGYGEEVWKWANQTKTDRRFYQESSFILPRFQSWKDGRQAEILRTFCTGVGIQSVKFHTLRSCFATQLIKDGVAPAILMKICGWKDLKTMQRYIRLAGIEVKGATESLRILPEEEAMGRVVELFKE